MLLPGRVYWYENQIDAAYVKFIESVEIARLMADSDSIRHNLYFLSRFTFYRGNAEDVRKYIDESQTISTEDPAFERLLYLGKAYFARLEKRFSDGKLYYLESLRIMRDTHGVIHIPETLEGLAVLSGNSQPEQSTRLFGVAQALRERIGYQRAPDQQAEFDASIQRLRERLTAEEFERLWQEGRGMTLDEAFREAGVGGEGK